MCLGYTGEDKVYTCLTVEAENEGIFKACEFVWDKLETFLIICNIDIW